MADHASQSYNSSSRKSLPSSIPIRTIYLRPTSTPTSRNKPSAEMPCFPLPNRLPVATSSLPRRLAATMSSSSNSSLAIRSPLSNRLPTIKSSLPNRCSNTISSLLNRPLATISSPSNSSLIIQSPLSNRSLATKSSLSNRCSNTISFPSDSPLATVSFPSSRSSTTITSLSNQLSKVRPKPSKSQKLDFWDRATWYPNMSEWSALPTEEPLSPKLREKVIKELFKEADFNLLHSFHYELGHCVIHERVLKIETSDTVHTPWLLLNQVCNKTVPFYWVTSPFLRCCGRITYCSFWEEWFEYHNSKPDIRYDEFVANLIYVISISPPALQEMLDMHKNLCSQAEHAYDENKLMKKPTLDRIKPTYRALMVVMDKNMFYEPEYEDSYGDTINTSEDISNTQTVLLIRTRDDSHLTAPIDFDSLRTEGKCLPLNRNDVTLPNNNVIRVYLKDAIKFVCDIEQKKAMNFPQNEADFRRLNCLKIERKAKMKRWTEEWVKKALQNADEQGFDCSSTWQAVRRAKAAAMGEVFHELELDPWKLSLKRR